MFSKIASLVSGIALAACSVVGIRSGTEEPAYSVMANAGPVEVRGYGPRLAAETVIDADEEAARSAGFRRLAGYIFGDNQSKSQIAMTAPVAQSPVNPSTSSQTIAMTAPVSQARDASGQWVVRFFLPREWTLDRLPTPADPAVHLVTVPAETIAVLGFSGDRGADAVHARQAELIGLLARSPWRVAGTPVAWFYDPPWTLPWLRRNEVAVPVAAAL